MHQAEALWRLLQARVWGLQARSSAPACPRTSIRLPSPALGLLSPGAGPVELDRGGALVLVLGFFSMLEAGQNVQLLGLSSGQRAAELSSIKRGNGGGERGAVSAGQAAKALIHFYPTRRPHHGDILTTKHRRNEAETRTLRLG